MDPFLETLLTIVGSIYIGWMLREKHAQWIVNRMIRDGEIDIEGEDEPEAEFEPVEVCEIIIEEHDNMYFAYKAEDNSFMGNSETMAELAEVLVKKYPEVEKFKVYTDESI